MAISSTVGKIGQVFSGLFLGLTGSWLLVICVGGLVTLGVLSLFHVGVLLSLGCIGVCLLVAGACWLYHALSQDITPKRSSATLLAEDTKEWSLQQDRVKKPATAFKSQFYHQKSSVDPKPDSDTRRLSSQSADA